MTLEVLIVWLIIGAIAGLLAGLIVEGYGLGPSGNVAVGTVGAVVAGFLLPRLGIFGGPDLLTNVLSATVGAIALLLVAGVMRRV